MNGSDAGICETAPELARAIEFWEELHGASGHAACALDSSLRYRAWNPAMEALTGISRDDVIGAHAYEVFPGLEGSREASLLEGALDGRGGHHTGSFHAAARSRDADAQPFDVFYAPALAAAGRVVGATVLARSQRAPLERKLQESESRFQTMADCAPVLLWMAETDGLCSFFNQTWLDFTGRTQEEEHGYGWVESVHPEDFQLCVDTYMRAFNRRESFEMVYRMARADGDMRWILDRGTPRYAADGSFEGYIGSCIDITDRMNAEEALRKAHDELEDRVRSRTAELERSNEKLDEFAHLVSHDLKEPLRGIMSYAKMLLEDHSAGLAPEGLERLERLPKLAGRLHELIEALLRYSSVGRTELAIGETDLGELVAEVGDSLVAYLEEQGVTLRVRGSLPTLVCDRVRVAEVFRNLIVNAVKYNDKDEKWVEVGARDADGTPVLYVRDNGIGIRETRLEDVFKMFKRLHGREKFGGGTGAGLSMVRTIIERHGGRIWAESTPGEGSTFCFTLGSALAKPDPNS